MPKHLIETGGRPLLDIASYARRGPGRRDHLSPAEIELIQRTVNRTPEVMVKVLTRGATTLKAVQAHFDYLSRGGELEVETDEGEQLLGKTAGKQLLENWDLELDQYRRRVDLNSGKDRSPPRLVHKILFSMPPGTPPRKVLEAVKNFAREEFALQHRHAMILHTDEPHPHVHLVVKAVSEQGFRLNIRKETLRRWRAEFARHLRILGVPANATERAVRGANQPRWRDAIYRADRRGTSNFVRNREALLRERRGEVVSQIERDRSTLLRGRSEIMAGWIALADVMERSGRRGIADQTRRFTGHMPATRTDMEWLANRMRAPTREPDSPAR